MGNHNALPAAAGASPLPPSIVPTLCGPTSSLQHLPGFYRKYQMGDILWEGRNSTVRTCRLRGGRHHKWDYVAKRISRRRIRKLHLEATLGRELMALREFGDHKCAVELVDLYEDDEDDVFVVFRNLRGGDLFNNIVKQGALREAEAARLCASVATALHECHKRNWVHRDVKPENILCTSHDMATCGFQLCDFGFACTQDSVTGSREFVGSVGYQAPEVIMECEGASVSPAADMWGLGCLLYVALTGSMPFFHRDDSMIDQLIVDGVVDLSEDKVGHLSAEAQEVLEKLFAYKPSDRLTMEQLLDHKWLQDALHELAPTAEPEVEPRLRCSESRSSVASSFRSSLISYSSRSSMSRDSSEESLTNVMVVPPVSAVPAEMPDLGREELSRLAVAMRECLEIKDRQYHFRTYRMCWLGSDGVSFLAKEFGSERVAVAIGDQMIASGLMRHVAGDHNLKKRALFYRFKEDEDLQRKPVDTQWKHVLHSRPVVGGI